MHTVSRGRSWTDDLRHEALSGFKNPRRGSGESRSFLAAEASFLAGKQRLPTLPALEPEGRLVEVRQWMATAQIAQNQTTGFMRPAITKREDAILEDERAPAIVRSITERGMSAAQTKKFLVEAEDAFMRGLLEFLPTQS